MEISVFALSNSSYLAAAGGFINEKWLVFWSLIIALFSIIGTGQFSAQKPESIVQIMCSFFRRLASSICILVLLITALTPILYAAIKGADIAAFARQFWSGILAKSAWLIPLIFAGFAIRIWVRRKVEPWLSNLKKRLTQKQKNVDDLSDIRSVESSLMQQGL